jgi:hypothetical protein
MEVKRRLQSCLRPETSLNMIVHIPWREEGYVIMKLRTMRWLSTIEDTPENRQKIKDSLIDVETVQKDKPTKIF